MIFGLPRVLAKVSRVFGDASSCANAKGCAEASSYARGGGFLRIGGLFLLLVMAGCSESGVDDFSAQFEDWYASNPPSEDLPLPGDIALLDRHRPFYWLGAGAARPVAFYEDYIARGILYGSGGEVLSRSVDGEILNRHSRDRGVMFEHGSEVGDLPLAAAVVYGRISRDRIELLGRERELVFLTYTLVFARSGLPSELSWWQELGARIFADPDDWHQLDHYINTTIVLDESELPLLPIAVEFQHHNYTRSWRLGGARGAGYLEWPLSGRLEVDIALRSNEAYPHRGGAERWPAASFINERVARWFVMGERSPALLGIAYDHTSPVDRLDLPLAVLAPSDAFYTFRGSLGVRRRLPGRSGPPGADYNTLAGLKRPVVSVFVSYWREGLEEWLTAGLSAIGTAWRGGEVSLDPFIGFFESDWHGGEPP
ncbi:MAG: hypothetical protein OD811_06555 [Alphaproteobacteria bacterium]